MPQTWIKTAVLMLVLAATFWPEAVTTVSGVATTTPGTKQEFEDSLPARPSTAEFPPLDASEADLFRRGLSAKVAAVWLAAAPDDPHTAELLVQVDRVNEALEVVRRIVERYPERLAETLEMVVERRHDFWTDDARGHPAALRQIVVVARSRLTELPAQEEASSTLSLLQLERPWDRDESLSYRDTLREFARHYAGTQAGQLATVNAISLIRDAPEQLAAFDRFVQRHPGTIAAAKALYWKAKISLGRSGPPGADPTDRFLQVLEIVEELESGRYPMCEWVERAPTLVASFYVPERAVFSAENLDRVLVLYWQFVRERFEVIAEDPDRGGFGFLVTERLPKLHARRGDGIAGVEQEFESWARGRGDDPAVRYLQALFYTKQAEELPVEERARLLDKAISTLESLSATPNNRYARKSLATLASLNFHESAYDSALVRYRRYLAAYPASDFAWLAALRVGQCLQALGDWQAAASAYRDAAASYPALAPASVLGHALAAEASVAVGSVDAALLEYRLALEAWDHDFAQQVGVVGGPARYSIFARRLSARSRSTVSWTRPRLLDRIATVNRSLDHPGGAELERGRWLLENERKEEAEAALEKLVVAYPRSPLAEDARYLAHLARLEQALELADIERPDSDEAAAVEQLEQLSTDTWDAAVGIADITRAAAYWKRGESARAMALMETTLRTWQRAGTSPPATPLPVGLAGDVAAIRTLLFRPQGGGVYGDGPWNGFSWPGDMPAFVVVNPRVTVQLANRDQLHVSVDEAPVGIDKVLLMSDTERRLLGMIMAKLGGTAKRTPRAIMDVPNQPIGASLSVLELWKQFFPARAGHWFGWVFETYPIVRQITFLDESRTQALAYVTIGYAGATAVLEKRDGIWIAVRLTNRWVT